MCEHCIIILLSTFNSQLLNITTSGYPHKYRISHALQTFHTQTQRNVEYIVNGQQLIIINEKQRIIIIAVMCLECKCSLQICRIESIIIAQMRPEQLFRLCIFKIDENRSVESVRILVINFEAMTSFQFIRKKKHKY